MLSSSLQQSKLSELEKACTDYSAEGRLKKIKLLQELSSSTWSRVKEIKRYHELLLFLSAYAEDKSVWTMAKESMTKLCETTMQLSAEKKDLLANSGIAFNETQGTFSFVMIRWLLEKMPDELRIHSFDESGVHPKELLKQVLNEMEYELAGDESLTKIKWLELASGTKNKSRILHWLIRSFDTLPVSVTLKEQLFESMKPFISIEARNAAFSRSFATGPLTNIIFIQRACLKNSMPAHLSAKNFHPKKTQPTGKRTCA